MVTCFECIGAAIASVVGLCAAMSAAVQDRVRSVNANYFFDRRNRQAQEMQEAVARGSPAGRSPAGSVRTLSGFSVFSGMSY
jgi:hypothetical protein